MSTVVRDADGVLKPMPVFVSPSVNSPGVLAVLLSFLSRTVDAGMTITDRDGRIIGITHRAGWHWPGMSIGSRGPAFEPDQPIVPLDSALALLGGAPERSEAIPAEVAYHGRNWTRSVDGPATRELIADEVQELLGRVGGPIDVEALGQYAGMVLAGEGDFFLELLYAEPQRLRTLDGDPVVQARYIVLSWGREVGLPDLLLCGETADRLGAAFAMALLGHLEQVMDEAPLSSLSVVQSAALPIEDGDFHSYPYAWSFATDKETYAFGEPVRLTLAVTNVSECSMPLDYTPPTVLIRGIQPGRDIALVLPQQRPPRGGSRRNRLL